MEEMNVFPCLPTEEEFNCKSVANGLDRAYCNMIAYGWARFGFLMCPIPTPDWRFLGMDFLQLSLVMLFIFALAGLCAFPRMIRLYRRLDKQTLSFIVFFLCVSETADPHGSGWMSGVMCFWMFGVTLFVFLFVWVVGQWMNVLWQRMHAPLFALADALVFGFSGGKYGTIPRPGPHPLDMNPIG